LAYLLANAVARPVVALTGFVRTVGGGDLDAKADIGGGAEFRELSTALNRMIADLRDRLRLRHSLDLAMQVQQQLLPAKAPAVAGLDLAGHSTYCDETGGDYYDFLVLDRAAGGGLLVALGDVMGHGVAAALVMASARAVLRDRAAAGGLAELTARLNDMLASSGDRFMTLHLSVVDPAARTFRWTSAGHDPAFVYDPAADAFIEDASGGLPLGVMPGATYEEYTLTGLKPGQVILIGTDGVWEIPNSAGEAFGKDRLREVIRASAGGTAAEITSAVRDRLEAFRGDAKRVDDVAFVVVKISPEPLTG
jgi:sigma-B regulation protein RsbU (phosphoserine phosphatase)